MTDDLPMKVVFAVGVVVCIALIVSMAHDGADEHRRVRSICASSFRQSHTGHDSLTIAALNGECAQMLRDSFR